MSEFSIREGTADDRACVYATWLHSYKHGSNAVRRVPSKLYFKEQHNVIESLLEDPTGRLVLATLSEDQSVILGWALYSAGVGDESWGFPPCVHYVYVKPAFRRSGIASKMLESLDPEHLEYSHETFMLRAPGIAEKLQKAVFNPYRAFKRY